MIKKFHIFEAMFAMFAMWYFLPVSQVLFASGKMKLFFFMFYLGAMAILGFYLVTGMGKMSPTLEYRQESKVLFPILSYILVFASFYLFDWKDAGAHIRISFTFWGVYLFYYLSGMYPAARTRVAKFLLLLYIITYITTLIGVVSDPSVARTISHAAAEDDLQLEYLSRNIASVYFVQTTVLLVPLAFHTLFYNKTSRVVMRVLALLFLLVEFYFILSASFTIALLLYCFGLLLCFLHMAGNRVAGIKVFVVLLVVCLLASVDFVSLFDALAQNIENDYISSRMRDLANMLSGRGQTGDAGLRLELYISSLKTFLQNPFGVGPNYSFKKFDEGLGHHSQLLDDLGRYGIFGLLFYLFLLTAYYSMLIEKYKKVGKEKVVLPTVILWIAMLILNLAFRSSYEAIFVFYLFPTLPDIILSLRGGHEKNDA